MVENLILYLLSINITLFLIMAVDKKKAQSGQWRIRERTLFFLGLAGGGVGGLLAMYMFHHKTQKPLFYLFFFAGIAIWATIFYLILSPFNL